MPCSVDQPPDMAEDVGARLDVEADGRLVEQQQARAVQQRARDLDPPHLAAREIAHLVAGAIGKPDARQHLGGAHARLAPADAVQGGVIQQVLHHREIEVERARLEHDAEEPQRLARRARDVMAEDADAPGCVPNSRVISENSVLLPAPLRPSSTVKLAGATAKLTSMSARRAP